MLSALACPASRVFPLPLRRGSTLRSAILLPSIAFSFLSPSFRLIQSPPLRLYCAGIDQMEEQEYYTFGPYNVHRSEVFRSTVLSFAFVNIRPVLPGHVLVCPRRQVKRFNDLTDDETIDIWFTAKEVGRRLEQYHKASSLTFTIQDGPQSGQTVPHLHIHILPRKEGDFENNDEIYDAIDTKEKEMKEKFDLDKERKDRTLEERSDEANEYRALFA